MIYNAMIGAIPYLQVSARNDDEARRRVIERCRKDCIGGLCKRWKDGGMAVKQWTNTVTFKYRNREVTLHAK